jgi:tetratricopeptide (TPR) repeat protein
MKRSGSAIRRTAAASASAALAIVSAVLTTLAAPTIAAAQPRCPQPAAIVRTVDNRVQVLLAATKAQVPATRDMQVCAGDTIEVAARSRAIVFIIASSTLLSVDQNSRLEIGAATAARPSVNLLSGALLFITRLRRSFEVRTPFVNASVEGTEFVVRVGADRTLVTVLEGTVRAANDIGAVVVNAGQQAVAIKGQAPQLQVVVRPRDAVQWALYYEPIVPADTFARLDAIPAANQDAAFFVRRAGLLLGVGQLEAARADLDQAQKLDPGSGDADALRAVVAVALNDKTQALETGRRGVERSPSSTSAQLALSYALQANFQLEEAQHVASQAVANTPDDASAWARLAELRLMLDDVAGADTAAQRAVMLAPQSARPHVVLGFTKLAQLKIEDAERGFEQAIALRSTDPLAHLGHGLATIRQGHLDEGRGDLELAVALSPDDAIIRSYLGKAYFDEKRELQAEQQFVSAKALDPLDPTAWYYDAIQKQSLNRPVEALADIEKAIQLNDNRAVYRSRLLLDDDSAGRGARLGRVYRDLGFEQLALVEGWKSVAIDPANHSAHRLLADNYLVLPRHQIARDSELLQSQLLQPLNINPVQPRLAGNGLNFLDDTGAFGAGYNEFTRLFAGNQIRFVGDGIVGQQGTRADNVIVSGLYDRLSFSAGQFHYQTDGIRSNNDARLDIYNVFLQSEITRSTSAQVEIRGTEVDKGDTRLLFDQTNFLSAVRNPIETTTVRIGGRQRLGRSALVIGSYLHHNFDQFFDTGLGFSAATKQNADSLELRYLQTWERLNITGGGGRYAGQQTEATSFGPFQFPPTTTQFQHTNLYMYADARLLSALVATAGISHDDFDYGFKHSTTNPKLGVTWTVDSATSVRAAAMRSLKRTLVLTQTIEPTHVAGFNQFFDDNTGAEAWRYGVGVDRRLSAAVFAGAEVSRRDIDSPTTSIFTGEVTFTPEVEWFAHAYMYATARDWLAVSGEYQFARLDLDPQGNNAWLLAESTTHKLGVEARAFARWGGFGRVRGWFVDQDGRFQNQLQEVVPGEDRFFTVDASFGYRLPRRLGIAALDIRNAFDKAFSFQDSSPEEPTLVPARQVSVRVTVTF